MRTWRMILIRCLLTVAMVSLAAAQDAADSANLYKSKCDICHGADGAGKSAMKNTDLHAPQVQKQTDAQLQEAVANGKGKMTGYKDKLSKQQIAGLVTYIRTLGGTHKAASTTESKAKPADSAMPRKTTESAASPAAKSPERPATTNAHEKPGETKGKKASGMNMGNAQGAMSGHMAAMQAEMQQMRTQVDKMRTDAEKVKDGDTRAALLENVALWQHFLDRMQNHMQMMGQGMMGMHGMMGHGAEHGCGAASTSGGCQMMEEQNSPPKTTPTPKQ
jgi:cytochrome c553